MLFIEKLNIVLIYYVIPFLAKRKKIKIKKEIYLRHASIYWVPINLKKMEITKNTTSGNVNIMFNFQKSLCRISIVIKNFKQADCFRSTVTY